MMATARVIVGDCREAMALLPDGLARTCVTSPPYFGLRDYGHDGQIGLEQTPDAYVAELVSVFRAVRRVLSEDGTLWLNLGDSYVGATSQHGEGGSAGRNSPISKKTMSGIPQDGRGNRNRALYAAGLGMKQLLGIPWRVAFALQADGWYLRSDIIWHKPNPMPESVTDRPTKAHEYLFLLAKSERYYYDAAAIAEPSLWYGKDSRSDKGNIRYEGKRTEAPNELSGQEGFATITETRNRRSVWTVTTKPYSGAHFATFPPELIEPCILAGSASGDVVLDPFGGSGTTGAVAIGHGRDAVLCELNPEYAQLATQRIGPMFTTLEEVK